MRRALLLGIALAACSSIDADRDTASARVGESELAAHLDIKVQGGSILTTLPATDTLPVRVIIRAQSLDVRIDVQSDGCAPQTVAIKVTQLPEGVTTTWRPLLDGVFPEAAAAREAAGGVVDFLADPEDRNRTPLAGELAFETAPSPADDADFETDPPDDGLTWTVHLDRSRGVAWTEPGLGAFVPAGAGACATLDATGATTLGQAALVARHRLRRRVRGPYRFAVWGNNSGAPSIRARIAAAVNDSDALFAVVNGDLTAEGTSDELVDAAGQLNALLEIPWFATPGDKDVFSELDSRVVSTLGATTFALDVGSLRLMIADSADAAFTDATHSAVGGWLADDPLWWPGTPAPPHRLLVTHVPPFDPFGARNLGFKSRQDAARVIAVLQRGRVPKMITSQFATFERQTIDATEVVHSGGAGAPIETSSSAGHHWLEVAVGARCSPMHARGATLNAECAPRRCRIVGERLTCPCSGGLWCDEGACKPCVTITQRPVAP